MAERKATDVLAELLSSADKSVLVSLIRELAADSAGIRRESVAFLKERIERKKAPSVDEVTIVDIMLLWDELEPDLFELEEYGGGNYPLGDHVSDLLYEICRKLETGNADSDERWELVEEVLPYVHTSNAGLDDALYDTAYAACKDDQDFRRLAEELEKMDREWPRDHARRIYRRLGDREKYLELRATKMVYGLDYHDLVTFHWEQGEHERALAVAHEGLEKATGRMDELHAFVTEHDSENGDRARL